MADKSYKLTLSLSDGSTINAGTITAPQGPNGANGVTFTPSVSAAGVLSWTNNGGLTNPSPISIKGPKGDDAVITESDVKGWGFTKNEGTITGIKMNGVNKGTSGVVDLGTVFTAHTGLVGGNLVQYDSTEQTLKDSGKKISDLATTSQVNAMLEDKQDKITSSNKLRSSLVDGLGAAAAKAVDTAITSNSTSTNLPTSKAVEDRINAHSGIDKVGTVTAIKINDATKNPASGVVDLGTFLTAQDISGLQDKLTTEQLNAVNSGITAAKVSTYDGYATSKQDKLSTAQLGAVNSGITAAKVSTYDGYADKITALEGKPGLDKVGTVTSVSVKMNGASKGTVTSSGTIDLGTVITAHQDISGKLDKTTYEVNKTIAFGSSGVLYVGKFKVYDTNVTCEVTSTTDVTYSGKLVIATQNYVIKKMTVYGDAANTVAPNFFIKPSTTSDPYIEVYFKPSSWSKNVVHIYGSEIKAEPTNVCTNVPSVPSTATLKPTNALNSKANLSDLPTYSLSGTTLTITL